MPAAVVASTPAPYGQSLRASARCMPAAALIACLFLYGWIDYASNGSRVAAMNSAVERLIEQVRTNDAVLAVLLFGSRARGEQTPESDVDLCLVLHPEKDTPVTRMNVRLEFLPSERLDIRIFQQLPLYVRRRVLKEGQVLYCRDLDSLYALAYRTAQAFEDFKPRYCHYLEQIADVGP